MFTFGSHSAVIENASILIHRPAASVFQFIGYDFFHNYPRWSPEVQDLRRIDTGTVRAGARACQVRMDLGHRSESLFTLTVFQPHRRVSFEEDSGRFRCDYTIESIASGLEAILSFSFEIPRLELVLLPFEGLIRETVQNGVARTVHQLKRLIESATFEEAA